MGPWADGRGFSYVPVGHGPWDLADGPRALGPGPSGRRSRPQRPAKLAGPSGASWSELARAGQAGFPASRGSFLVGGADSSPYFLKMFCWMLCHICLKNTLFIKKCPP